MSMLTSVLFGSGFGLAARCWQLAIMKRNIAENLGGHALSMGVFGGLGALYYNADQRVLNLLEEKKEALRNVRGTSQAPKQEAEDDDG